MADLETDGWRTATVTTGDHFTVDRQLRGLRRLWAMLRGKPTVVTELFVVTSSVGSDPTTYRRYATLRPSGTPPPAS